MRDFARRMTALCDDLYPDADEGMAALDVLNTQTARTPSGAFVPADARRLAAEPAFQHGRSTPRG